MIRLLIAIPGYLHREQLFQFHRVARNLPDHYIRPRIQLHPNYFHPHRRIQRQQMTYAQTFDLFLILRERIF